MQWEWRWNEMGMGMEHPFVVLGSPTSLRPLFHGGSPVRAAG